MLKIVTDVAEFVIALALAGVGAWIIIAFCGAAADVAALIGRRRR